MTQRICSIEGCDRDAVARGWCLNHYKRERRRAGGQFVRATVAERLAAAATRQPNGCLEWDRARHADGYGHFYLDGRIQLAHRAAWIIANGPIPDDMNVCHRCDNPPCIDPAHLFLGTQSDNVADMVAKGRHMNNRRTHCKRGHEFTEENTRIDDRGNRNCRTCTAEYQRAYNERRKLA